MELNLKYYNQENEDLEESNINELLEIIKECKDVNYEEYLKNENISTYVFNNISSMKQNIINWYDFEVADNVLEIGTEYGIITDFLCSKFTKVVSVDYSKKRAELISKKLGKKSNLQIIVGKLKDIKLNEKFSYITLIIDESEYKNYGFESFNEIICYLKGCLKENGTILVCLNNKFGVKSFSGASDANGKITDKIQKSVSKNNPYLSKNMIENILKKNDIANYRFFYPLPDFNLTSVIFTDEYLPKKNDTKLMYPLNYLEESFVVFNENKIIKQLANDGKFQDFTNSYLIEIRNDNNSHNYGINDDTLYVSFNNNRKKEYRTITKITKNGVKKIARNELANEHIKMIGDNIKGIKKLGLNIIDEYDENKKTVFSTYSKDEQLSVILCDLMQKQESEKFTELVSRYYTLLKEYLSENLSDYNKKESFKGLNIKFNDEQIEKLKELKYVQDGYIDLVFENIFVNLEDKSYKIFDQEWYIENIPLEYILYRALNNIYIFGDLDRYYSYEKMLKNFGILEYKDVFELVESKFQEKVIDTLRANELSISYKRNNYIEALRDKLKDYEALLEKYNLIQNELDQNYEYIKKVDKITEDLRSKLAKKEEELNEIYNSKSWKMLNSVKSVVKGNKK